MFAVRQLARFGRRLCLPRRRITPWTTTYMHFTSKTPPDSEYKGTKGSQDGDPGQMTPGADAQMSGADSQLSMEQQQDMVRSMFTQQEDDIVKEEDLYTYELGAEGRKEWQFESCEVLWTGPSEPSHPIGFSAERPVVHMESIKPNGSTRRFFQFVSVAKLTYPQEPEGYQHPDFGPAYATWHLENDLSKYTEYYTVMLDGRLMSTARGRLFRVPTKQLAELVALEFDGQGKYVRPGMQPVTSLCLTVLDGIMDRQSPEKREEIVQALYECLQHDPCVFRVEEPAAMRRLQKRTYDPILKRFNKDFRTSFTPRAEWDMSYDSATVRQDLERAHSLYRNLDPWTLGVLWVLAQCTHSAMISHCVWRGYLGSFNAVEACMLEEHYQQRKYGKVHGYFSHDVSTMNASMDVLTSMLLTQSLPATKNVSQEQVKKWQEAFIKATEGGKDDVFVTDERKSEVSSTSANTKSPKKKHKRRFRHVVDWFVFVDMAVQRQGLIEEDSSALSQKRRMFIDNMEKQKREYTDALVEDEDVSDSPASAAADGNDSDERKKTVSRVGVLGGNVSSLLAEDER